MFSLAVAGMIVPAVGGESGRPWLHAASYLGALAFGLSLIWLFLVFPVRWVDKRWGKIVLGIAVAVHIGLAAAYAWSVAVNPEIFDLLRPASLAVHALDILGACCLAVASFRHADQSRPRNRQLLALIALGAVAGLAPFLVLTLLPDLLGLRVIVPYDIAILPAIALPVSLSAAVLSRQYFAATRLVRRGLVAIVVWVVLSGTYTVALFEVRQFFLRDGRAETNVASWTLLVVALCGGTFWPLQHLLRQRLEHWLFHDVYDYAATLRQMSGSLVHLRDLDGIANQALSQLCASLDLSWAEIRLAGEQGRWLCAPAIDMDMNRHSPSSQSSASTTTADARHADTALRTSPPAFEVTLVADGEAIGCMAVGPKWHDVDLLPADTSFLETYAPLVASALRGALLLRELREQVRQLEKREQDLASLHLRLTHAQEAERRRVSLDIHDDPLQRVILLARNLGNNATPDVAHWRSQAEDVIHSLRAVCADLRPPRLDDLGLPAGLEWLVNDTRSRTDLTVSLVVGTSDGKPFGRLAPDLETALYRVAQEAINNCVKHARASRVITTLSRQGEQVTIRVTDDGCGFAHDRSRSPRQLGLLSMQERLNPWNGKVVIAPAPGGGTTVVADVAARSGYPHVNGKVGT